MKVRQKVVDVIEADHNLKAIRVFCPEADSVDHGLRILLMERGMAIESVKALINNYDGKIETHHLNEWRESMGLVTRGRQAKKKIDGMCTCCGTNPKADGNRFLCGSCASKSIEDEYSDPSIAISKYSGTGAM